MFNFEIGLYRDELYYSYVGRNLSLEPKDVRNWILDSLRIKNRTPNIQFSSYLNRYKVIIPRNFNYDNDYLIQYSTLLPLYAPFLSNSRKINTINKITGDNPTGLYELLGVPGGHLYNYKKCLRYCPLCVKQDIQMFGEAYFHRIHHVDGVLLCPEHGCLLGVYENIDRLANADRYCTLNTKAIELIPSYMENKNIEKGLIHIASEAENIMNLDYHKNAIDSTRKIYYSLLKEKGFLSYGEHVRLKELCRRFKEYYNKDLLISLNCDFELNNSTNWIRTFFGYKNIMLHPIKHILLINFLTTGITEFFNNNNEYSFFGQGPWPCLNPAAKHYKQPVVKNLIITEEYKTKRPVGTFACNCGFVYSRRGPDKCLNDKYKVGCIKQYGHEWEERLKELILQGMSLRAISQRMKCDTKTVVKYGRKLGLDEYISSNLLPTISQVPKTKYDYRIMYEKEAIDFISEHSNCDKKMLREYKPKEFLWLEKYDLNWLNQVIPVQKNYSKIKGQNKKDWPKIDAEISEELVSANTRILSYKSPVKVTKTLLGQVSGRLYYLKNKIDKLPQTKKTMDILVESAESYKIRKQTFTYRNTI